MPDGLASSRVATEAIGRARALRRAVNLEDQRYVETVRQLLAPVRVRLRRYPGRNLCPQLLADLERGWQTELASPFRVSCCTELSKESLHIAETSLSAATVKHTDWEGEESGIIIAHCRLVVGRGEISLNHIIAGLFSLHALARRLQRGVSTGDDELLDDIALVATHNADEVHIDEGFAVPTKDGRWLGRCVKLPEGPRTLSVRTWLDN